jgi:anti-sigma regulatory factor (Ser/Thr protein kinase)
MFTLSPPMPEFTSRSFAVRDDLTEVSRIQEELEAFWKALHLPDETGNVVSLALEEVLSNVLRHGRQTGKSSEILVCFRADPLGFEFEVSDAGTPYNPLLRADPDLTLPISERRPGGLGVYMVKQLADAVTYEWRDSRNHVRFLKRLPVALS